MTTQTFDGYYVFEADQVLTNDHLNQQFYYLDQQERWTRNKLIGTGIVCGLDITSAAGLITISKGSGVTSEGYLILLENQVSYDTVVQYKGVPQPADLPFTPDLPATYALPFFNTYCGTTTVYQLLASSQYTTQNPLPAGSAALTTITLNQYAVVLFLEINEKDLKNCDTQDCNNKGEKMDITIQALLVPVSALPSPVSTAKAKEIKLRRYNVPYAPINNTAEVLTAFYNLLNNGVINEIAACYAYCYDRYQAFLPDTQNPFANMASTFAQQLNKAFTNLWSNSNRITVQYLYDYIDDLILAYYEFRETASAALPAQCCGDELAFPLHLVLGPAGTSTDEMTIEPYRTYFIYSALFDGQNQGIEKMRLLFNRMKVLSAAFNVNLYTSTSDIKITPSQYRHFPLSERCIPFYYNPAPINGTAINQCWNFNQTLHGNTNYILGYNSSAYNNYDDSVSTPLLYDIEQYNFFRIEGHIGQQYSDVLSYIINQRLKYNLPFDVVAISAELLTTTNTLTIPACNVVDLESELRLLIIEFLSKLFLCIYKLEVFSYDPANLKASEGSFSFGGANINGPDNSEFVENFKPEFLTYQYGDFYAKYVPFASIVAPTLGGAYVQAVQGGAIQNGVFTSPVDWGNGANLSYMQGYANVFELLFSADALFYLLLNTKLSDLGSPSLLAGYERFNRLLVVFTKDELAAALFDSCGCECLVTIVERILAILAEYQKRLNNYMAQLSFLNYYKKHPGLEHKAGVPKGGTFVVVYHEESREYYDLTTEKPQAALNTTQARTETDASQVGVAKNTYNIDENTLETMRQFVDQCADAPATTKRALIDLLPQRRYPYPGSQQFPSINNGVIIADFYVPYLCCSDCAPIAYIIDNKLNVYTVSGGGSACANNTDKNAGIGAILLSGSDVDVNYNLYNSSDPTFRVTMTGTGNPLNFGVEAAAGTYTVTAASADGNTKVNMNGSAMVILNAPPTIYNLKTNGPATYCIGSAGVDVFLDGSDSGVKYQLLNGTTADPAGPVTGAGSAVGFGNKPSGSYTVVATNPTTGCVSTMQGTVVITASAVPAAQTVTGGGSYCANNKDGIIIGLKDSENGVTYQLFNTVNGVTGPAVASVAGTGGALNFARQFAAGTYSVVAKNGAGCTTNMSNTVSITVLPVPSSDIKIPPATATDPKNSRLVVTLTAVETNLTYNFHWTVFSLTGIIKSIGIITAQPAVNIVTINIPITGIGNIMASTKGKGLSLPVSLSVTNGECVEPGNTVDLWPILAPFAPIG